MKNKLFILLFCHLSFIVFAQPGDSLSKMNGLSFEQEIPGFVHCVEAGISRDSIHRVSGKYSLRWDFEKGETIQFNGKIGYRHNIYTAGKWRNSC